MTFGMTFKGLAVVLSFEQGISPTPPASDRAEPPFLFITDQPLTEEGTRLVPVGHPFQLQFSQALHDLGWVATDGRGDLLITPRHAASRQHPTIIALEHQADHVDPNALCGLRAPRKVGVFPPVPRVKLK